MFFFFKIHPSYKINFLFLLFFFIFFSYYHTFYSIKKNTFNSDIIKENFFIIDSNNLRNVQSHMYGFSVSKDGFFTDNYYKKIKNYKIPENEGVYIMIKKNKNEIIIYQDFYGSIGIYLYENKKTGYFAISNSFLLLEEHLIGKHNFTLNKDFADDFIIEKLTTPSISETLVKEIIKLPANGFITIDIIKKTFKFNNVDYKENTIPLDSKEGLEIIDKWADKWGFIIRSLYKLTDNIMFDLSGGFDSRLVLAILLNSGVNINDISINSNNDTLHVHDEDFKIATNISSMYGFKLNAFKLDKKGAEFNTKDSIFCTIYSKMGFQKEFYIKKKFLNRPHFHFTGLGGGIIRGFPGNSLEKYIESLSSNSKNIKNHQKDFHDATLRLINRSVELLKQKKKYKNEYEISTDLYFNGRGRVHYGTAGYESFIANIFKISPLLDSQLYKIKINIKDGLAFDIPAYIYVRFAHNLINIPFQGKRILNPESIKRAEILNNKFGSEPKKHDFNLKFYIDNKRKSPVTSSNDFKFNGDPEDYIKQLVNSNKIYFYISKIYDDSVYKWAIESLKKLKFHPLKHIYSLLAIAKTLEDIAINHQKLGLYKYRDKKKIKKTLFV